MTRMIIGNWKMFKTSLEARAFVQELASLVEGGSGVGLAVPFTALKAASEGPFRVGAQNMSEHVEGPYTGEISARMIQAEGGTFCLIGHSERRHLFGESDAMIHAKVRHALFSGLQPVLCVGETAKERQEGQTETVIKRQLEVALSDLPLDDLIIAYEPVWAIGSGVSATPEMAQDVHHMIRMHLKNAPIPLLYGGSVKVDNIGALMEMPDINGALVGGASLDPKTFSEMIKIAL